MKKVLLVLFILLIPISFLLLHDKGNEYLRPYLATYLESKLNQEMSVDVQHLKIDLDHVELNAILNELTSVKAQGEVSLLSQLLDIDYNLKSNGFKTLDNKIDINGTAVGTFNDLNIQGKGETLKSHIDYSLNVKDDAIHNIKVNINKADLASILELTAQPAYAQGKVDIDINIPTFEDLNTKGKAKIVLYPTTLNEKVFKKELRIDLPKKTIVTANIDSKISAKAFEVEGDIKSNLLKIKLSKANYTLKSKELLTDYLLTVPELSKLKFLTQQQLNGALIVNGKLRAKKGTFNTQGNSKSLGGETNFNFDGKALKINMQNVVLTKLFTLLGTKPYLTGKLMADVHLSKLKNLTGTFNVTTKEAKTINHTLKKELNVNFGRPVPFSLNSKGDITSNVLSVQNILDSDVFNYRSNDMQYDLKNSILSSTYALDIPNLSKLNSLAGKSLKGSLTIKGKMNYDHTLELTGSSPDLGGNIDFKLAKQKLNANIDNVTAEKLMYLLDYPQIFKAILVGELNYDLATREGTFNSKLNKAQLLSNQLTVLIQQIRGLDLTKERYNETNFNAILDKDIINFNFKAKSKKVLLEIPTGLVNKVKNTIDAKYKINIGNNNIEGKIKGNISNPDIIIDPTSILQDQVMNVIKDSIPEDTLKDMGLDNMEPEAIKNTVEEIFGGFFK